MKQAACDLLSEFADITARTLANAGFPAEAARSAGVEVSDAIAAAFGGATLYIPQNYAERIAARDQAIALAAAESDAQSVGIAYGISTTAVYRAIRRFEARRAAAKGKPL